MAFGCTGGEACTPTTAADACAAPVAFSCSASPFGPPQQGKEGSTCLKQLQVLQE